MEQEHREGLGGIRVKKVNGEWVEDPVEDESDHFYVCKACGQAVDMRCLGQVIHHETTGHKPLDLDS